MSALKASGPTKKRREVFIAVPIYREVPSQTAVALLRTTEVLNAEHVSYQFCFLQGNSQVCCARNLLVQQFLETTATHLFWLDADMVWEPRQFVALLDADKDCVSAPYMAKTLIPKRLNHGLGFCCVKRAVMEKLSAAAPMGKTIEGSFPQVFQYAPHLGIAGEDIEFYRAVEALGYQTHQAQTRLGHVGTYVYQDDAMPPVDPGL